MEERFTLDSHWADFAGLVAKVLEQLPTEGAYLILSRKPIGADDPNYYVQFAIDSEQGLRAEAVSNEFLSAPYELTSSDERTLWELGWRPPMRDKTAPAEVVNFNLQWPPPPHYSDAARMAAATLQAVYGVVSPGDLYYKCFLRDGRTVVQPTLGIDPLPLDSEAGPGQPAGPDIESLRTLLDTSLREILGVDELNRDDDGDVAIRFGSAAAFVRLIEEDFPSVHVFSPVVGGLTVNQEILEAVNDINLSIRFGRAVWESGLGGVVVVVDLPSPMVTKENIAFACEHVGTVADYFDDQLQEKFGGSIAFGEARPPKSSQIGGYL